MASTFFRPGTPSTVLQNAEKQTCRFVDWQSQGACMVRGQSLVEAIKTLILRAWWGTQPVASMACGGRKRSVGRRYGRCCWTSSVPPSQPPGQSSTPDGGQSLRCFSSLSPSLILTLPDDCASFRSTMNKVAPRFRVQCRSVRVLRRPVIRPDVQLLRLVIVAEGGD